VLALLFGHADKRFYQRQIIQMLGLGSGSVQRELAQMTRVGILTRTTEGRQTYFQANRECPIFDEIRGLVRKTFGIAAVLKDAFAPLASRIRIAFIYGSVAAGTETGASDVDLMVIGDVSTAEIVSAIGGAQHKLGREVNPSIYPAPEFCRKLSEGRHFITSVVNGTKIFLIGDERQLKELAHVRVVEGAQDKPSGNRRPSFGRRP
jgi:hypothetical protein